MGLAAHAPGTGYEVGWLGCVTGSLEGGTAGRDNPDPDPVALGLWRHSLAG